MSQFNMLAMVWIAATCVHLANGQARGMCKAGAFFKEGSCKPCPKGTYQNVTGSLSCEPCPEGTFFRFTGGQGVDVCEPCPAGTFNNQKGATSSAACKRCPTGKNSIEGSPFCLSCAPGQVISFCEDVEYPTSVAVARRMCQVMFLFDLRDQPLDLKCRDYPDGTFSGRNARHNVPNAN